MALVTAISFFSGGWLLQRGLASDGSVFQQARLFDEVMGHVSRYYVDSLGDQELYKRATDGMLEQLQDPYSVLLTGEDYKALTEQTSGNYAGLGIQIDVRGGWITVVAPLPETPAERAGIETGDQIVEVDGKSTEGWKNDEAVKALRGTPGSKVRIKVRRAGLDQLLDFTLTRANIHQRSVPKGTLFEGGVGYISLNPVAETSADELKSEIAALKAQGMKSLVLNLRNNPGGLLDQGVKVADLFLDANQEIVSTRGRARGSSRRYVDEARQLYPELPIVVLVNAGSASAAEIIAGALQDHDRAVVIGTPTFGKGLVQTLFPLGEGTALKLTTARWYTPSGRTIQREAKDEEDQALQALNEAGELPDSVAETSDSALKSRPVFRTDAGRIVRGGGGIVPDIVVKADSLTSDEKEFARQVGEHLPQYRDVLTGYALDLKRSGAIKSQNFAVSPQMLDEMYKRLTARDVQLTREVFDSSSDLVGDQLGYEIARYVFGAEAELRRRALDDKALQKGLSMLRQARTPKELLTLASTDRRQEQASAATGQR
jgi:carboxyl-terminal processing protease